MTEERLGDGPIEPRHHRLMNTLADMLDDAFNGDKQGADRTVGFILMAFDFRRADGLCNYISNADRAGVVRVLEDQLARFKAQAAEQAKGARDGC
jgi:hypothetical protein